MFRNWTLEIVIWWDWAVYLDTGFNAISSFFTLLPVAMSLHDNDDNYHNNKNNNNNNKSDMVGLDSGQRKSTLDSASFPQFYTFLPTTAAW